MSRDTASINNPILRGYIESDARAERLRRQNRMKQFRQETEQEAQMMQAEEDQARKARAIQREAALAEAVGRQKMQQLKEEKEIQRIREEAPELRALRLKLAAAQVNQERATQIVDAHNRHKADKVLALKEHQMMEDARIAAVEQQEAQEQQRRENLRQQKSVLEKQMTERDDARLEAYREFLKEKLMVDEIVRRIQQEDEREFLARMNKQQQTQAYIAQYLEDREQYKKRERERQDEEDRQIVEFMKLQAKRKEDESGKIKAKHASAQRILEEQSRAITEKQRKKEEMEDILNEYYQELKEEKERKAEQEKLEKKIRDRVAMIQANEYQKKIKAAKQIMEKQEEEEFRQMMMEKFAEDDRLEQMNAIKRNQRRAEHNREVQKLIEQKRAMRAAEMERERDAIELEREREERKQQIIEQERRRLLQEHAVALQAFLPKGILRADDIDTLGLDPSLVGTLTSLPKV